MHPRLSVLPDFLSVRVINFADNRPLAVNLQQVEEVGEAKARDVVRVYAGAGGRTDNIDPNNGAFGFGRRLKVVVNNFKQSMYRPAGELPLGVHAKNRRLIAEGGLHNRTVRFGSPLVIFVQHFQNCVVFMYECRAVHGFSPIGEGGANPAARPSQIRNGYFVAGITKLVNNFITIDTKIDAHHLCCADKGEEARRLIAGQAAGARHERRCAPVRLGITRHGPEWISLPA